MLELRGIHAGYGAGDVLHGVDVEVGEGEVVAVLGPNGAGKTTLLRTIAGLVAPSEGAIVLDGASLLGLRPHQRVSAGLCLIPEGRGVFPALTVRENIMLQTPRGSNGDGVQRAVAAFPRLGERLDQVAGTMSGGEQQMLALSRAYVQSPRVVLLDEVSMGLAPKVVDEIFEFIRLLAREGVAMLLVEQYVARAMDAADHVYVLNNGEVVADDSPSDLETSDIFAAYLGGELSTA